MEVKPGYKQTEVGVIPEDWNAEALGPHVEIKSGQSPSLFRFESEGVPYFKVEQLNNNSKYLRDTCYFIRSNKKVARGSLIFPKRGASILINKIRILEKDSFMDTNLMTLTPKASVHHEYLYYALTHIELWRIADTTSIPQINNKHIIPLIVPLPPTKAEQEAIAEALSDADALIESLEQLIVKKRHLKQGTMQELLTGKKRLPGFSGEWEVKPLGQIGSLYQPQTISQTAFSTDGYPVYGANGIIGRYHRCNHYTWQITISCRGNCGTVNKTEDKSWITGNAMVVNCDSNKSISKLFLYYLLSSLDFSVLVTGSGQPQIVRGPLAEFQIILPVETSEQTAIAAILSDMDAEIAALEGKLAKTHQIKQGMMQELLTGRIRLI